MTINYQQAKRIRKVGLMDLFADQLMHEKSIGKAIGKTISLKTQAKIKGFKEHFDPLNIAKKLTFGSSWGPALLGHLMGRDTKDIQYFSGRLKPIRDTSRTGNKITKLPKGGSDSQAMNSTLRKMYKLLTNTHEQNIRMSELVKNREEENQINDEKRHKELIKALMGLGGSSEIAPKEQGEGIFGTKFADLAAKFADLAKSVAKSGTKNIFGSLYKLLRGFIKNAIDVALKGYEWIKKIGTWARNLLGFTTWPEFLAALGNATPALAFLLPFVGAAAEKAKIRKNPYAPEYKNNPYAMVLRGEAKTEGEAAEINRQKTQKRVSRKEIQEAVTSSLKDNELKREYGADRPTLEKWLKDNPSPAAQWQAPVRTSPSTGEEPKIVDNSYDNAEMAKLKRQSASGTAVPVVNESVGQDFIKKNDEVMSGRVAYGKLQRSASISQVNNTNVSSQNVKTTPLKRPVPSVRNQEEEFQSRMFENTVFLT